MTSPDSKTFQIIYSQADFKENISVFVAFCLLFTQHHELLAHLQAQGWPEIGSLLSNRPAMKENFAAKPAKYNGENNPDNKVLGLYGAPMGPIGPMWAPCWPHETLLSGLTQYMHFVRGICFKNAYGSVWVLCGISTPPSFTY